MPNTSERYSRKKNALYIDRNINRLPYEDRIEILQIIYNEINGDKKEKEDKIKQKPKGSEIKFSILSDELLKILFNYIKNKKEQALKNQNLEESE